MLPLVNKNAVIPKRGWLSKDWNETLRQCSYWASILCILDCTILPIVTLILPLLGFTSSSESIHQWLHELGRSLALYFVLPVGSLTATTHYLSHKRAWIGFTAMVGLGCVWLANANCSFVTRMLHLCHGSSSPTHHHDHGMHRIVNISGCALLLGSNYVSQRVKMGCCSNHSCNHHHASRSVVL